MSEYQDPAIGKEVDGYRIQGVLGQGGMGIVYDAEDVALSRRVALKMIDPGLARDAAFLRRFRSEARALARIDSSYIVGVYALRETELGLFIVMEYVDGGTVEDRLLEGPMPWQEALPIIRQMLQALDDAHSVGVIHRDIKPANIMLSSSGTVKVTDFGLAKLYQGEGNVTVTQGISGTLYYMSPEQVKGVGNVDHRSDLYSTGMTIYKMLTGGLPFERSEGEFTIMRRIVEEPMPRIDAEAADVPPALVDFVDRALVKDPDKRFQSAAEMLEALERLPGGRATAATAGTTATQIPAGSGTKKKSGLVAAIIAALVLVAAGGGVAFYLMGGESAEASDYIVASITSDPEGATVYLDGSEIGQTPIGELRHSGQWAALQIEMDGYEPLDTTVQIQAGAPLSLEFSLREELDDGPAPGTLRVTSTPADAAVFVDGRLVGQTPYVGEDYAPGSASVRIEKDGYERWTRTVNIEGGQEQHVSATLTAAPPAVATGDVNASIEPAGTVTVGSERREGGGTFSAPVGRHRVLFTHPNYGEVDTTVTVSEGQTHHLTAYFEQSVLVNTVGPWASVWINGENIGENTPARVMLPPGEHRIELRIERSNAYRIAGGTYRYETDQGSAPAQSFSDSAFTIHVEPGFHSVEHFLVFRVEER